LKRLGWLEQLPFDLIPNYANLDPQYLALDWDKGAKYFLPWQAGYTGLAYNLSVTGREITSIDELFNDEWKGRIGLFTEMRDTVGLTMLAMGHDPAAPTADGLEAALDRIADATSSGQVRRFTGND